MTFAWPHLLWLAIAPVGWLIWDLTHRRRSADRATHPKILRAEAGAHSLTLASSAAAGLSVVSRGARPWLCLGLVCAIVALARPQWGRLEEPVFDQSREILIAIDLSRSMLAPDIKPTRLDRAKLLIQSLLEKLAGERVGLVVFSGTAFLQSPLSSDYEILREFLPSLTPDFLPEGGSNYAAMLEAAAQAFSGGTADRFLVVLSDGESTEPEWRSHLAELKNKSIRVLGLGIGTIAGSMIPDESGGFVKDERGAVVLSKLESGTLQELATSTGGAYRDASTWIDLAALVNETIEAGRKGEFVEKNTVRLVERFQWPLALGLWCLLVSLCYEFPVRPRPRQIALGAKEQGARKREQEKPRAAVAALVLLLAPCSLLLVASAHAAATLAPPASSAAPLPSPLARIVGRLSNASSTTARDWAELARETVTWGSRLQSEQQPVPEGPVRDALQAVDLGAKEDAKTADWPKLREELEALLKKPEEQNRPEQSQEKNESKDQNKDQKQQQDQQKQDQSKSQDQQQAKPQSSPDAQNQDPQKQNQPQDQKAAPPKEQEPKPGESAFGDMKEKSEPPPPPPPQGEMQKVGGAPEKKEPPPESANPALAVPMQKLEQLRNQDSPARLFELMQGEKKSAPKKPGKDW